MIGASLSRPRQTLAKPTGLYTGVGLHSGQISSIRFLPARAGVGRVFVNKTTRKEIAAVAANVSDTSRCTQLRAGDAEIQTVEHVLAALAGLDVDDALIEIEGPEPPAADGSSAPYVDLIRSAGLLPHGGDTPVRCLRLSKPCFAADGKGGTIVALPAEAFSATVVLDYPNHPFLGTQAFSFDCEADDFATEIAPARTFGFLSELESLREHGLALGASLDNAVALREDGYESELRFSDELARHKLLDLIGDLSLIGMPPHARVLAIKPGHALNTRLAMLLVEQECRANKNLSQKMGIASRFP